MRFRPALWPTVISLPMLIVVLGLGTWQLQRLAWKTDLIDRLEQRLDEAPVAAPATYDPDTMEFLKIELTGVWEHDKEMLILGRPEKGTPGFHIVTPLRAEDGRHYIVNRGWIPDKRVDFRARPESRPDGVVTIQGMIRGQNRQGWFRPDNEPERDIWMFEDPAAMAARHGLADVAPYLVVALDGAESPRLPVAASPRQVLSIRNEHLNYALTWFGMAIGLIVIYFMWHRQQGRL